MESQFMQYKRHKEVDHYTKYIIAACIREIEPTLASKEVTLFKNIPLLVTSLCAVYYFIPESFDEMLCHRIITNFDADETSYGAINISSASCLISEWQIRIKHIQGMLNGIDIGISSNTHHYGYYGGGYIFETCNGNKLWKSVGTRYGLDDIITMRLDFKTDKKNGTLRYFVNDTDQKIEFLHIPRDTDLSYRLTVGTTLKGTMIEIMKFTQK